ncbi:MAG: hypothetical protein L3K26_06090 [Candidatus Hydrogenedentes bacterium]|nr:hypothetical protein [Candidatus Hydrogenedentota bacterium]
MKYPSSIAIDAGLLVLLVVGRVSPTQIGKHKRLRAFAIEDYDALLKVISRANRVVLTPNTLTEASNLATQTAEPLRSKIRHVLRYVIEDTEEIYVTSHSSVARKEYSWLGLTDSVLLEVVDQNVALLTADSGLHRQALLNGGESINFNHIRDLYY